MDHHCVFTMSCIGYNNYKIYYQLLFYSFIGGVYQFIFVLYDYLSQLYYKETIFFSYTTLISLIFLICYASMTFFTMSLLIQHTKIVLYNTGTIEGLGSSIHNPSDFGKITNILMIFGSFWGIFIPLEY